MPSAITETSSPVGGYRVPRIRLLDPHEHWRFETGSVTPGSTAARLGGRPRLYATSAEGNRARQRAYRARFGDVGSGLRRPIRPLDPDDQGAVHRAVGRGEPHLAAGGAIRPDLEDQALTIHLVKRGRRSSTTRALAKKSPHRQPSTTIQSIPGRQSVTVAGPRQSGHTPVAAGRLGSPWRCIRSARRRWASSSRRAACSRTASARSTCSRARSWSCRLRQETWKSSPCSKRTRLPERTGLEQAGQAGSDG